MAWRLHVYLIDLPFLLIFLSWTYTGPTVTRSMGDVSQTAVRMRSRIFRLHSREFFFFNGSCASSCNEPSASSFLIAAVAVIFLFYTSGLE